MKQEGIYCICIICGNIYFKRKKGMKQKRYRKILRPYRCMTCSSECAKRYNRTLINKRNILKMQWRIKNNVR